MNESKAESINIEELQGALVDKEYAMRPAPAIRMLLEKVVELVKEVNDLRTVVEGQNVKIKALKSLVIKMF